MSERRASAEDRGQASGGLMGLGRFLTRRPVLVVGVWVLVMVVLGLAGRDLGDQLQSRPLYFDGTEAKRAHEITLSKFGSDESMVVALHGSPGAVGRQGQELSSRIDALPETVVVSPWSASTPLDGLRPSPEVAGIVVRVEHRDEEELTQMLELVEEQIGKTISAPVEASITGLPKLIDAYSEANEDAARTGEMIAIPVLLVVLLLVFRSVLAALIPIVVGASVVSATEGIMRLLIGVVEIDAFALGAAGMMGLALGVDYSLLVVSRFREERLKRDLPTAVQVTVEATGRSVIPAGLGLLFAMLVASQILPGVIVSSSALAIMLATVLSVISALCAVPAIVLLLGSNIDRWSLPARFALQGVPLRISKRISRSPAAVAAVFLVILMLASWSATLDTAIGTPEFLPPDNSGRVEGEKVERYLGPGWLAPIEVVAIGRGEPMTSPDRLRSLSAFQKRVEGDEGVQTMAGFGDIERQISPLDNFEGRLVKQERQLSKLDGALSRINNGATSGQEGLQAAAAGARQLGTGVGASGAGAGQLVDGLDAANTGSDLLSQGLGQAGGASGRLAEGTSDASASAGRLSEALAKAEEQAAETKGTVNSTKSAMRLGNERLNSVQPPLINAEERLAAAWQAMQRMTSGTADPEYANVRQAMKEASRYLTGIDPASGEQPDPEYGGVGLGIERAKRQFDLGSYLAEQMKESNAKGRKNVEKLANASQKLDQGIEKLADGAAELSEGVAEMSAEGQELSPALRRLRDGTQSLANGLGRLSAGADDLAGGLDGGVEGQELLVDSLRRINSNLNAQSGNSQLDRLRKRSPGLFDSGYFYLAGLDGSDPSRRKQANFMIDLDQGGHTSRMLVIPRHSVIEPAGRETLDRVRDDAAELADATGAEVVVGGRAASQLSINEILQDRTAIARIALMLVTLLILIPVLRSLIIPIAAAFLNVLTVAASLGVLALMFDGSLLGGPGYVDSAILPAVMMVIFGLAIDYEVFIFARMREEYVRTGSPEQAIENGLRRTAPVVTGAAFIMIAVFLSFSVSSFITLRNFGVAQATAVFIDAFIVRLIVVPGLMRALGKWSWWMPRWLDRLIPGGRSLPGAGRAAH